MIKKILLPILLLVSVVSFGQVPAYVPSNGLVGWWGFNGNANDESGNGNNGTVNGATLATDRFGNINSAYDFDGVDDYIESFPSNTIDYSSGITIASWVFVENQNSQSNSQFFISRGLDQTNGHYKLYWNGNFNYLSGDVNGLGSPPCGVPGLNPIPFSAWVHAIFVYDFNEMKLYLNGALVDVKNYSAPLPQINSSLYFGRHHYPTPARYDFNGKLDDIGIWNRALTPCEIKALYLGQTLSPPTVNIGQDTLSTCGATTTLDAGTDPAWASYLWNTTEDTQTISVSNPGLYTVEVTDTNGCIGYDTTLVSIIDPTIDQIDTNICIGDSVTLSISYGPFITYLGGSDRDEIREIVTDDLGNIYVYGVTWSADFPTTNGAYQSNLNGITDLFLSKFSPSGELLWSTLIGGSGQENGTYNEKSMTIDNNGDIYIGGGSSSNDYPTTPGAFQNTYLGGTDAVLSKFNSSGSLIWSTYYGGSNGESINGITINENNDVIITGYTYSINLPVTPGVYQTAGPNNPSNNNDMFTVKFDESGNRDWASFYGNNNTGCNGGPYETALTISKFSNKIAFGGYATNYNLSTTTDAFQSGLQGGCTDMFYSIFDNIGQRVYASYYGGNGNEKLERLNSNNQFLFLGGWSNSTNLPLLSPYQTNNNGNYDAVYSCFDINNNLVWSTYLGGSGDDFLKNQIIQNDILYGVGATSSANFPTTDNSVANNGGSDFFITKFDINGQLLSSSVNGGDGDDVGHGIVKNTYGIYIAGFTTSSTGLATLNAFDTTYNGGLKDGFIAFYPNPMNITWSTGDTTSSITVQPTTTTTYSVTVDDGISSCTDNVTITVNDPQVTAGADQTICNGDAITLSGAGASTYAWDNGVTDGVAISPTATADYIVTGTDTLGCVAEDTTTITVNPLPTVDAGTFQQICDGDTVTLSGTGAATYAWDNGLTDGTEFTPSTTTLYTVIGTDANGCIDSDTVSIGVWSLPLVDAGADQTICDEDLVTLSGSGASTYSWDNSVVDGVGFSPSATTTYTLTGTDANGCSDLAYVTVTVNPLPAVDAGAAQIVCTGTPVTLSATGAVSYTWNNGVTDGVAFTPTNTLLYEVTGTDANSCEATDTVTVTVVAELTVLAGTDQTVCEGTSVTLSGSGANTYTWTGGITNAIPFTASSTTIYVVTGSDGNNCEDTDSVTVNVNPTPDLSSVTTNVSLGMDGEIDLSVTNGTPPYLYDWDNDGIGDFDDPEDLSTLEAGTYSVIVTDDFGCSDTLMVIITEDLQIFISTVITPNGDGMNDTWGVTGLSSDAKVQVLNRWGQVLYNTTGYAIPWDGTNNGEPLPASDYYYIIDLGQGDVRTGTITLKY